MNEPVILSVSEFVVAVNQTLEFAYPYITLIGEISNFRVSKNKWVYFDLKDETASLRCFGTVYQLPGPLEDGLKVQVTGTPRLHPLYNLSFNLQSVQPIGEGSLKRAADLLYAKLDAEGLFSSDRKRQIPYPPESIGLITSGQSAAYADFIKILKERWMGVDIMHADVQVQGEPAIGQIVRAIEHFNAHQTLMDVLVITRGGGSTDDLAVFSTEPVVRAIAASRIPTLVAIGHEVDISLAELVADQRASTPSNAAELLTPHKKEVASQLHVSRNRLAQSLEHMMVQHRSALKRNAEVLASSIQSVITDSRQSLTMRTSVLGVLNPASALGRGYALITNQQGNVLRSVSQLPPGTRVKLTLADGVKDAVVE